MPGSAERTDAVLEALTRFSSWLERVSPYHRALRTPVYLEPGAPLLVRAFWERVGWSEAIGSAIAPRGLRPERALSEREAMKVIRNWCAAPALRDRWGVNAPDEVEAAVRARLPAASRFVLASPSAVTLTDESTGADDPPVLRLEEDGSVRPSWRSYVEMLFWQTCGKLGVDRGAKPRGAPVPAAPGLERPFTPALDAFWTLGDGVWALGAAPGEGEDGAWEQVIYQSPAHYFRHVVALPDGEIERFRADPTGMCRLAVTGADALDPERSALPGLRRFVLPGSATAPTAFHALVEWRGARLWLEKWQTGRSVTVHAEPEQAAEVEALLAREGARVREEAKPRINRFAHAPSAAEAAAAAKLHERARRAAEVKG